MDQYQNGVMCAPALLLPSEQYEVLRGSILVELASGVAQYNPLGIDLLNENSERRISQSALSSTIVGDDRVSTIFATKRLLARHENSMMQRSSRNNSGVHNSIILPRINFSKTRFSSSKSINIQTTNETIPPAKRSEANKPAKEPRR